MASKQNVEFSPEDEYQYFLYYKKFNSEDDVKYVESEFNKNWYFKPYYLVGFDGKTNGFIDNPNTMNLNARKALGLPHLCPSFRN